jgi:hypothetical protein
MIGMDAGILRARYVQGGGFTFLSLPPAEGATEQDECDESHSLSPDNVVV